MNGPPSTNPPSGQGSPPALNTAPGAKAHHAEGDWNLPARTGIGTAKEATATRAGTWIDVVGGEVGGIIVADSEDDSPRETDQLVESLPLDLAKLDRAIQHYLDQIDGVGGILADLLAGDGPQPWLIGATVTCAAAVIARRCARRRRSEPILAAGGEGLSSSWLIGLSSEDS